MRPEEQKITFKKMPGTGGTVHVPRLRGGRPSQIVRDKTKYDRKKEDWRREMVTVASLIRVIAKTGIIYDSFSTQIDLPADLSKDIKKWCTKNLSKDDLYNNDENEYGLENDHHVTILYGIKEKDPQEVKSLLADIKPFKVRLGLITAFRDNDKYDVLKIDAEAPELHKMHYTLADNLENDHSFPTYAPHMTLAYVKKGVADKFLGEDTFRDKEFNVSGLKFCLKDSSKLTLNLGGKS